MRRRPAELLRVGIAVAATIALIGVFWVFRDHLPGVRSAAKATTPTSSTTPTGPATVATPRSPVVSPRVLSPKRFAAHSKSLRDLTAKAQARSNALSQYAEFTMVTYNVLGASHTGGHGDRASWASGPTRMRWAIGTLDGIGADVIAFQEFQSSQAATFRAVAGGTYEMFPSPQGPGWEGQNTVAWRRSKFEMVTSGFNDYPYFGGHLRPYPMVLLKDRQSGVEFWVTSQHNPFYKSNAGARHRAVAMEAATARRMLAGPDHHALIFAGDMNDHAAFYCAYAGSAPMHSASGGSVGGGCSMPPMAKPYGFDWIMGSPGVEFSGWDYSHAGNAARTSDHPVVWTHAKVWKYDHRLS